MRSIIFGTRRRFGPNSTRWLSVGHVDDVVGGPEILANERRFVLVERPLEMRRQEAVHHVHAGRQAELGDPPQHERLVGGLLGVFAEQDDPAGVEGAVDVVVAAVHVESVFGEGAGRHFQHHRRALARRVVVLLNAVHNALPRRVVDDTLAAHGVRNRTALGGVLAFGFDGNGVAAKDVELALGKRLLVELAAFCRGGYGVEDASIGDPGFSMVRNQLIAIGGDANPRIPGSARHGRIPPTVGTSRALRCLRLAVLSCTCPHSTSLSSFQ